MHQKTIAERQQELQALLATEEGKAELHELAARYGGENDRLMPARTSVVTYILVHERLEGMITG